VTKNTCESLRQLMKVYKREQKKEKQECYGWCKKKKRYKNV